MLAQLFINDRHVQQIHLGGGRPTHLSIAQIQVLIEAINNHFVFFDNDDFGLAIEIDSRTTSNADIVSLASIGINRLSFGIQDFDESVQKSYSQNTNTGRYFRAPV